MIRISFLNEVIINNYQTIYRFEYTTQSAIFNESINNVCEHHARNVHIKSTSSNVSSDVECSKNFAKSILRILRIFN